ncbi:MAG: MMPL family transporter [Gaiellales bacterium]|nr:MMPL family transporter [Gaiellales bacterium]
MFHALGRFSYRFRWLVIGIWVALLAAGLVATPYLAGVLKGGGFSSSDSPSQRAATLMVERLNAGRSNLAVVFTSPTLEARSEEFQALEAQALAGLTGETVAHLTGIQTYAATGAEQLISTDGSSSVAILSFDTADAVVQEQVAHVRQIVAEGAGGLTTYVTGQAAVDADLSAYSMKDLRTVEIYALPVALLALLVVFGTLVAAALPVLAGGIAVSVTLGVIYLVARATDVSIFVMNTATLLGLAVAIDYALFIVARFREELAAGATVRAAVTTCTERAGRSVFFSGLAVAIGVLGLLFFPYPGLRSIALGGAIVVFFSVATSLTLIPALLAVLGNRVNALRVVPHRPVHDSRFWRGWTAFVSRRPWAVLVVSLLLILLVASPVLYLALTMPSATALPAAAESRQGYDTLDTRFDRAALSPISVMATWQGGSSTLSMEQVLPLYQVGQTLAATPGVASVTSLFNLPGLTPEVMAAAWPQIQQLLGSLDLSALGGAAGAGAAGGASAAPAQALAAIPEQGLQLAPGITITREQAGQLLQLVQSSVGERAFLFLVTPASPPTSAEARDLARRLAGLAPPAGLQLHVAGEAAAQHDFFQGLTGRFPWVIAYVLAATYLVLLLMLRSLLLPLKAILVNALTILMSIGCLVFIFQDGRLQGFLGYTSTGATDSIIMVVIFCALFGISMDYGVFSLTRMHEAWLKTRENRESIRCGLLQSGRVILSAALLVVVVTAAFAFTRISLTKELGIGIALAIALDAMLVRMSLVPALMCYLGRANWWMPAWLERLLPDTGHEGGTWRAWRRRAPGAGCVSPTPAQATAAGTATKREEP